jgi:hypothetical protein
MLYTDPDSGSVLPRDATEIVVGCHRRVFDEWLRLPLVEQLDDIRCAFETLSVEGRQTALRLR